MEINISNVEVHARIRLKGVTNHGKNRIREHGEWWVVLEPKVTPPPSMLLIKSVEDGDTRWLNHHFEIIS